MLSILKTIARPIVLHVLAKKYQELLGKYTEWNYLFVYRVALIDIAYEFGISWQDVKRKVHDAQEQKDGTA